MLAGSIERVTFHNPGNGFCVLRIKARGHPELVTVVGHVAEISAGEWVTVSGAWVNDGEHGQQCKAAFLRSSPSTTAVGINYALLEASGEGLCGLPAGELLNLAGELLAVNRRSF